MLRMSKSFIHEYFSIGIAALFSCKNAHIIGPYLSKSSRRSLSGLEVWAYAAEIVSTVAEPAEAPPHTQYRYSTSEHSLYLNSFLNTPQSTYVCRVQSSVWRLPKYWPPTPFPPSECVLPPPPKAGGGYYTLARRWGGWGGGSIFWKTPDIGLASYNIIYLRNTDFLVT
jgi:hypothetical protein